MEQTKTHIKKNYVLWIIWLNQTAEIWLSLENFVTVFGTQKFLDPSNQMKHIK